ncbi:MAG: cellulase family glycosylhydrolase [Verrucomicrobia bacterium]|nr:cellulase family glycosylhydrolase [Verrucomicrobiota bacterium]
MAVTKLLLSYRGFYYHISMKKLVAFLIFCTTFLAAQEPLAWLSCKDAGFVDEHAKPFIFRGINIGSWLAEEMWMIPIVNSSTIKDHVSLWKAFETRFGYDKMDEIRTQFRYTWIQDQDFANIKAAGFNTVRLPFLYDLSNEPKGLFHWLDYAVDLAKKHGLYIILDMHGVPGRQSDSMHTGDSDKGQFFEERAHLETTCKLWKEIASRYKNCPNVAGYDLINEPMNAPSKRELYKLYDTLYKAIRSEDSRHIIFIQDGYKGLTSLPKLKDYKWLNVALSSHHYVFDGSEEHVERLSDHLKKIDLMKKEVQFSHYLGEFNVAPRGSFTALEACVKMLHQKQISYSFWSYKIGRRGHKNSLWAIYHAPGNQKNIDPTRDSYRTILKKIDQLKTKNYERNRELIALFAQGER